MLRNSLPVKGLRNKRQSDDTYIEMSSPSLSADTATKGGCRHPKTRWGVVVCDLKRRGASALTIRGFCN